MSVKRLLEGKEEPERKSMKTSCKLVFRKPPPAPWKVWKSGAKPFVKTKEKYYIPMLAVECIEPGALEFTREYMEDNDLLGAPCEAESCIEDIVTYLDDRNVVCISEGIFEVSENDYLKTYLAHYADEQKVQILNCAVFRLIKLATIACDCDPDKLRGLHDGIVYCVNFPGVNLGVPMWCHETKKLSDSYTKLKELEKEMSVLATKLAKSKERNTYHWINSHTLPGFIDYIKELKKDIRMSVLPTGICLRRKKVSRLVVDFILKLAVKSLKSA